MTYVDTSEVRGRSMSAMVLVFGLVVFAALGSFWTIVWFIRSYVEPPRVGGPLPMSLASRESRPVPASFMRPPAPRPAEPQPVASAPRQTTEPPAAAPSASAPSTIDLPRSGVADRWAPMNGAAAALASTPLRSTLAIEPPLTPVVPAPGSTAPIVEQPVQPAQVPQSAFGPEADEIVASLQPAISGIVPKPRPRPTISAPVRQRSNEPPLPRPRPDGSAAAPPSAFSAVPVADDRYPQQQN